MLCSSCHVQKDVSHERHLSSARRTHAYPCVGCLLTSILVLVPHVWTVAGYHLTRCLSNTPRKTGRTNDEEAYRTKLAPFFRVMLQASLSPRWRGGLTGAVFVVPAASSLFWRNDEPHLVAWRWSSSFQRAWSPPASFVHSHREAISSNVFSTLQRGRLFPLVLARCGADSHFFVAPS